MGGSVICSDTGVVVVVEAEISLSSSSSGKMGFSTDPYIDKSWNLVREKGVSMLGLNTESSREFSLLNSMSSRSVNW